MFPGVKCRKLRTDNILNHVRKRFSIVTSVCHRNIVFLVGNFTRQCRFICSLQSDYNELSDGAVVHVVVHIRNRR